MNIELKNNIVTWKWDLLSSPSSLTPEEMEFIKDSSCKAISKSVFNSMTTKQAWTVSDIPKVAASHISSGISKSFFNTHRQ